MLITRHLRIIGLVHGVGYRHSMVVEAIAIGVAGWVRNRFDGSVEALAQGEDADVQRLIEWAQRGPATARVDTVTVTKLSGAATTGSFELRPTV